VTEANESASIPEPEDAKAAPTAVEPAAIAAPDGAQGSARVVRAGFWALSGYAAGQMVRLASNLVLTRLLVQEAFGLMAIVSVVLQGLMLFSDVGINRAIVQNKRGEDPLFVDTAFTIQVVRGVALWLATCVAARPLAALYDAPLLAQVLPIAGLNLLASGFNSTKLLTQNRKLAQKQLAKVEVGSQLLGTIVMVALALMWRSVWALIVGSMAISFFKMVLSHTILSGARNRLRWHRPDAAEMFQLGRWLFVGTALTFLASQSDRLIFGKLVPLATLGVYNIAVSLAAMPMAALGQLVWNVLFPVLSRKFESDEGAATALREVRAPVLLMGGVLTATMAAAGPFIIDALYDDRYAAAGWMLRILALTTWFALLQASLTAAAIARGRPVWSAITSGAKLAALVIGVPTGYALGGFPGAIGSLVVTELIGTMVLSYGVALVGVGVWSQDLKMTLRMLGSAAVGLAAQTMLRSVLPNRFVGQVAGSAIVFVIVLGLWAPGARADIARFRRAIAS